MSLMSTLNIYQFFSSGFALLDLEWVKFCWGQRIIRSEKMYLGFCQPSNLFTKMLATETS